MSVSIEQLEAFIETNDQGSFSAAARHLNKAQSVISTLVSNLEVDLGVELFDRSSRYPLLSDSGKVLLERARNIIEQRHRFIVAANEIVLGIEGQLRIVIESQIQLNNLAEVLKQFAEKYPNVDIQINFGTIQEVWSSIKYNQSDLGILVQPENPLEDIDFQEIGTLELVSVVCNNHPLAKHKKIKWEELKQHRQILIKGFEDSSMNRWKASYQYWQVSTPAISQDLVNQGLGWAVLPLNIVKKALKDKKIKKLDLVFEKENFKQQVDLIWSDKRARGPASIYLSSLLSKHASIKN